MFSMWSNQHSRAKLQLSLESIAHADGADIARQHKPACRWPQAPSDSCAADQRRHVQQARRNLLTSHGLSVENKRSTFLVPFEVLE